MSGMKTCPRCGQNKPLDQFHKNKGGPQGHHSYCKPCSCAYYKAIGKKRATPQQRSGWSLKTRYGLTKEKWHAMIELQGGGCAICGGEMMRPVVDHNHDTGSVRGILCHPCNVKLHAVENVTFLSSALKYLDKHK